MPSLAAGWSSQELLQLALGPVALDPVLGQHRDDQRGFPERGLDLRRELLGGLDLEPVEPEIGLGQAGIGQLEAELVPEEGDPAVRGVIERRLQVVVAGVADEDRRSFRLSPRPSHSPPLRFDCGMHCYRDLRFCKRSDRHVAHCRTGAPRRRRASSQARGSQR